MLNPHTRGALIHALVDVEARHERHGWDLPPTLIGVFDRPLSSQPHDVHVDAGLFDPDVWYAPALARGDQSLPPGVILHSLADLAGTAPGRKTLRSWLHHDGRRCIGFALVFEAWAAPIRPGYRHGDLAKAPSSARIETRVVAAVDLDGQLHQIKRIRGARHAAVDQPSQPPPRRARSHIAAGLDRLMDLARTL
ncbi:hypothetical protein [Micromonospora sp. NPDC092111]|uniref:hypothetical protein n=1 Tax=Micromonospora sp. NPDC092111 TaxID=3364289 RepID=UPI003803BC1E